MDAAPAPRATRVRTTRPSSVGDADAPPPAKVRLFSLLRFTSLCCDPISRLPFPQRLKLDARSEPDWMVFELEAFAVACERGRVAGELPASITLPTIEKSPADVAALLEALRVRTAAADAARRMLRDRALRLSVFAGLQCNSLNSPPPRRHAARPPPRPSDRRGTLRRPARAARCGGLLPPGAYLLPACRAN